MSMLSPFGWFLFNGGGEQLELAAYATQIQIIRIELTFELAVVLRVVVALCLFGVVLVFEFILLFSFFITDTNIEYEQKIICIFCLPGHGALPCCLAGI